MRNECKFRSEGLACKLDAAVIIGPCFLKMHSDGCFDEYDNLLSVIKLVVV